MIDYQGEKFRLFLKRSDISVHTAAELLKVSRQAVYLFFKTSSLKRETVNKILDTFRVSESDIWGENGPRLEAKPLHLASDPNDHDNDGSRFEDLGDGTLRMRVPIIPAKAQAGYLRGFQDPEYYDDLKTLSVEVYKEHRGNYLAFEVDGDSMMTTDPSLFEYMALPGWKAVGREVQRHHWKFKLHTHKTDTWIIVHNYEGILIKNIVNHDVDAATITIHSLNPKYQDEVLQLNDIAQIFSVVKYIIDK
ncbi:LexA family transcriptional regulator [Mucilaginibacter lappiensis]|uniref:Phage repressor protein C with HTH and peptisase S24 domain n=1 Tax=Mucilaginibacter lappiensis TaxID=354630 RepID=A0A841JLG6_9SPHI|nr:helix-turn-helix transcriptional regulator [Mucilaginibacter lappiensis]MBB6131797.1 phage repressor protein C with HTH and peptisase S24 domain [Mucilaginibacter lappiensis]